MQRIRYSKYIKPSLIIIDIIVIFSSYFFFYGYSHYINNEPIRIDIEKNLFISFLLVIVWILISGRTNIYNTSRNINITLFAERLVHQFITFGFIYILVGKIGESFILSQHRFKIIGFAFFIIFSLKIIGFILIKYYRTLGKNHRNIMILDEDENSVSLKKILNDRKDYGYKFFNFPLKNNEIIAEKLIDFWIENGIHTLFISMNFKNNNLVFQEIAELTEKHSVNLRIIPDIIHNDFFLYELKYIETFPILRPVKFPLDHFINQVLKRVFDIVVSSIVLIFIASWLFPIIAILLYFDSKGPIFFKQERSGFMKEKFNCYKFRSMVVNEDSNTKTTLPNDERITKFGNFLRKSSLDEMPQFYNIFLGEMSCVGPRPHMLSVDDAYRLEIQRYGVRSSVKPGLTGLSQVNGLRGEKSDMATAMRERILSDAYYVKNWNLSMDIIIMLKTIHLVVFGDKNAL